MCCRYYIDASPSFWEAVEAMNRSPLMKRMVEVLEKRAVTEGEVRPTNIVPVLAPDHDGNRAVYPMLWGFTGKSGPLINARSETAAEKPTFRESWQKRRCVVPASWYTEWTKRVEAHKAGDRYNVRPLGGEPTYLAGLYRFESKDGFRYPVFTVLTREPAESIRFLHDRMPVILPPNVIDAWIRPGSDPDKVLQSAVLDLAFDKAE